MKNCDHCNAPLVKKICAVQIEKKGNLFGYYDKNNHLHNLPTSVYAYVEYCPNTVKV